MDKNNAKQIKQIAEALLKRKNISYAKWLNDKHLELLAENSNIMLSSLDNDSKNLINSNKTDIGQNNNFLKGEI